MEKEVQKILAAKMRRSKDSDDNDKEPDENNKQPMITEMPKPDSVIKKLPPSLVRDLSIDDEFFDCEEYPDQFLDLETSSDGGTTASPSIPLSTSPLLVVTLLSFNDDDPSKSFSLSPAGSAFSTFLSTIHSTAALFGVESNLDDRVIFHNFLCPNICTTVANSLAPLAVSSPSSHLFQACSLFLAASSDLASKQLEETVDNLITFTKHKCDDLRSRFGLPSGHSVDVCFLADSSSSLVLYEALTRLPGESIASKTCIRRVCFTFTLQVNINSYLFSFYSVRPVQPCIRHKDRLYVAVYQLIQLCSN